MDKSEIREDMSSLAESLEAIGEVLDSLRGDVVALREITKSPQSSSSPVSAFQQRASDARRNVRLLLNPMLTEVSSAVERMQGLIEAPIDGASFSDWSSDALPVDLASAAREIDAAVHDARHVDQHVAEFLATPRQATTLPAGTRARTSTALVRAETASRSVHLAGLHLKHARDTLRFQEHSGMGQHVRGFLPEELAPAPRAGSDPTEPTREPHRPARSGHDRTTGISM